MSLGPALSIFLAVVALLLLTVVFAIFHGKKVAKRQAGRKQDTEKGLKISAPMLSMPKTVRNPDGLLFVPTTKAERVTKIQPLPRHGEWI